MRKPIPEKINILKPKNVGLFKSNKSPKKKPKKVENNKEEEKALKTKRVMLILGKILGDRFSKRKKR